MLQEITDALQAASLGPAAVPFAFLLGLVSAVGSVCCTLPAMSVLVAYSGTRQDTSRRTALTSAVWFLIGTTLALIVLGLVAGLVGQTAQALLGRYWKIFAGAVAVLLGLVTLKWLPLPRPQCAAKNRASGARHGRMGAALGGLFLGGGVAAFSLCCNPGIFVVIGASVLLGRVVWAVVLMAAFGVGFGLPLSVILFGVSFGKASIKTQKIDAAVRGVAGVLLVGAGLYLLASF